MSTIQYVLKSCDRDPILSSLSRYSNTRARGLHRCIDLSGFERF